MAYLPFDKILEINTEAIQLGLHLRREQLLAGLNNAFVAQIKLLPDPASQMLSDLTQMNQVPVIIGNEVPLYRWLSNAAYTMSFMPDKQAWFRALADQVMAQFKASDAGKASAQTPAGVPSQLLPEKVIFINDMVPFGFLKGAARTGAATARLMVPSFQAGQPRTWPMSSQQKSYFGTGWLLGPKHIITNHHVVNARDPGDPDALEPDFKLQGERTTVQFDYDAPDSQGLSVAVTKTCFWSKMLDYSILELQQSPNRSCLPLWGGEMKLDEDAYLPVNIIQHPGGNPKQMGIRNNLAAKLTERDIAYFTDTEGGSSGSAVCNDDWNVMALHKASDQSSGKFEYQGKTTAWINVGTRIDKIIADLKQNQSALWQEIGATVVG